MEFRHLRCFMAVAEKLHFARTTRSTRLTRAGTLFLEHVPRVFAALEQARDSAKAGANGFHGQLRVVLSDGITPSRFPSLLARCREEEPDVEVRLFEMPLSQQIKCLLLSVMPQGYSCLRAQHTFRMCRYFIESRT